MAVTMQEVLSKWAEMSPEEKEALANQVRSKRAADVDKMGLGEFALETASNIPSSTYQLGKDVVTAVANPVQTASTLWDLAKGTVQNITGLGDDKEAQQLAGKVYQYYKDRYGSLEAAKYAVSQDPAGVMGDLSAVLKIGQIGTMGKLGKTGETLGTLSSAIEPLEVAGKVIGKTLSKAEGAVPAFVGGLTGTGGDPLSIAYQSGKEGGQKLDLFTQALREGVDTKQLLADLGTNIEAMRLARQNAYKQGMAEVGKTPDILDFSGIDKAIDNVKKRTEFEGVVTKPKAAEKLNEAMALVNQWKTLDPARYHTAMGFDALKQQVGDILEGISFDQPNTRAVVGDIYNAIGSEISKLDPNYAKVMADYAEASDLLREINTTLSQKPSASVDTQMRKLTGIMRNNVNTSYGYRGGLVDELEAAGGVPIKPQLAGMTLDTWTPRGIQGGTLPTLSAANVILGQDPVSIAQSAALSIVSSPRLMAESARAMGVSVAKAQEMFNKYPTLALIKDPAARVAMYQTEEAKRQGGRK